MHNISIEQLINNNRGCYAVLTDDNNNLKSLFLDSFECVILAFHYAGYSDLSHIRTIYQIFTSFLESSGYQVENVEVTDYREGIGYTKVKLIKNSIPLYFNCNFTDGLIIANLNRLTVICNDEVWNKLDDFDENEISEYDQEF